MKIFHPLTQLRGELEENEWNYVNFCRSYKNPKTKVLKKKKRDYEKKIDKLKSIT